MRRARPYRIREALLRFDGSTLGDLDAALTREWLETNGLGGFASSTIVGLNTRRYHGLLVAALKPPVARFVLLSKLEETLVVDGRRYELSANRYPGVIHPQGYRYLTGFCLHPFPVFTYDVDGVLVEKSVWMVHGQNSTVIEYVFANIPAGADVLLGPFVTAYLKVHRRSAAARRQVEAWLRPLHEHLREAGLGQISELFDRDPPYTPRGCIAQAWSVAELLRAIESGGIAVSKGEHGRVTLKSSRRSQPGGRR